jgi:hypothetical protein
MEELVEQFVKYLETNLNIRVQVSSSIKPQNYPFYLTQDYTFYDAEVLGHRYILQLAGSPKDVTPSNLKKQWDTLRDLSGNVYPIYVTASMTAFNRKRLIQQKIPFVVPGNQMYLPDLGLDLREYFKREQQPREYLSPSAQHCLISLLLSANQAESNPSQLAKRLNYAVMTMSRAISELVSFELGDEQNDGGVRRFWLNESRQTLWLDAQELLRDPISQFKWVKMIDLEKWNLPLAGESALSRMSDLNPPRIPCYALGRTKWKEMQKDEILISEKPDHGDIQLQIWRYDPDITARDGMVDPFSLYISLRSEKDERVQGALEDLIGGHQWYQD